MNTEHLEYLTNINNPAFVELMTAVLSIMLVMALVNIALLVGVEVGGWINGYPGKGIELFMKEMNALLGIFFKGE